MNPQDIFVPHGVPYEPKSTPIPPRDDPSPPQDSARVVFNHVDDLGIATVILHKTDTDTDITIPLQYVPHTGLVLGEWGQSVLRGTHLAPTMNLVSINGCDCSGMSLPEAELLISSTVGELTLKGVHTQVLPWSTQDSTTTPTTTSQALVPVETNTTNSHSALVVAGTSGTTTTNNNNNNNPPPKPIQVKVVVQKPSKRSSVGITVANETRSDTTTFPIVVKVDPQGLCAHTALQVGMRIWSVNGLRCYTKDDTVTKFKRAKTTCVIEAIRYRHEEEEEEAPPPPPRRSVIRSLSPKKWLPHFTMHRTKADFNAQGAKVEIGESA